MKNKILLLLVLLIPSLCFGKSLKITAIQKDQTYTLDFLDSTDAPNGSMSFSTNEKRFIEWSKQDIGTVQGILFLHFPKDCEKTLKKYGISKDSTTFYLIFQNAIKDLAVLNDYQVTFTESEFRNPSNYIFTVFLYKQD